MQRGEAHFGTEMKLHFRKRCVKLRRQCLRSAFPPGHKALNRFLLRMKMRCTHNLCHTAFVFHPRQLQRLGTIAGAVIHAGENVCMKIRHSSSASLPEWL